MELKNEAEKASPFGRGGGVADGEGKTSPLTRYRGSSPRGRALRDAQLYGCEIHVISAIVIPRKCYFSAEKLGWWYLISRGSIFPSVDKTFPYRVMSHPRFGTVAKLL